MTTSMSTSMSTTPTAPSTALEVRDRLRSVARTTGLWYLGLAVTGMSGQLIRGKLYSPGDAGRTAAHLVENEGLARLGIAADLGVVLTQAAVAVWFFILFRRVHAVAAGSIAGFGVAGSVMVLVATIFSGTALSVALAGGSASAEQALLLSQLQDVTWLMGGMFFGLWLIPMGWLAQRSGYVPRPLGWTLLAGGLGYLLSSYVDFMLPDATVLANALIIPATIGELWMIGYLLSRGISPTERAERPHDAATST
jgi:hypothetical protein